MRGENPPKNTEKPAIFPKFSGLGAPVSTSFPNEGKGAFPNEGKGVDTSW